MQHSSIVQLERFDYGVANRLGVELCRIGTERALPIGIEVFHGNSQVFLALLPGAKPDNIEWMRRKRAVALRFLQSSLSMRLDCEAAGVEFSERYRLSQSEFTASGGAVLVSVAGSGVIGCVTVSGLPDVEDDALVRDILQRY